jgi:Protein of unknown function (DUF4256)
VKAKEREALLQALRARFEKNMRRHAGISWAKVRSWLDAIPAALTSLQGRDATGGEPDVIGRDNESGHFTFCDCAGESPIGRRSTCYDGEAREARKENSPENSAAEVFADRFEFESCATQRR